VGWESFHGIAVTAVAPTQESVDVLWDDPFTDRL
jgi:hypothetical protein